MPTTPPPLPPSVYNFVRSATVQAPLHLSHSFNLFLGVGDIASERAGGQPARKTKKREKKAGDAVGLSGKVIYSVWRQREQQALLRNLPLSHTQTQTHTHTHKQTQGFRWAVSQRRTHCREMTTGSCTLDLLTSDLT